MKKRIFHASAILASLPLVTILLAARFRGDLSLQLLVILLGMAAQAAAVLLCRRDALRLMRPSRRVLLHMGVSHAPAAYQPGRLRTDCLISGAAMWAGAAAPLLVLLAARRAQTARFARTLSAGLPGLGLLLAALACILLGAVAFAYWVRAGQASFISNAPGEQQRYLYQGFAQCIEDPDKLYRYLALLNYKETD